jgi:LytR cell envelope-related transcriptional attenuator
VLDTTGGGKAEPWAQRLEAMGYEVISVQPGLGPYPETTVYWSRPSERPAAKALAARFGWSTGPRPGNLSPEVSIHVVLGEDEG